MQILFKEKSVKQEIKIMPWMTIAFPLNDLPLVFPPLPPKQ
jgi:hypothetical protein